MSGALALDHLRHQVVAHRAVVAGEARDEPVGVGAALERQLCQAQATHPALGAAPEQLEVASDSCRSPAARRPRRGEREVGGRAPRSSAPPSAGARGASAGRCASRSPDARGRRRARAASRAPRRPRRAHGVEVIDGEHERLVAAGERVEHRAAVPRSLVEGREAGDRRGDGAPERPRPFRLEARARGARPRRAWSPTASHSASRADLPEPAEAEISVSGLRVPRSTR